MILEPKHNNFEGQLQIKETVLKKFNIMSLLSIPRALKDIPLKGQIHEIFYPWFFSSNYSSWAQ